MAITNSLLNDINDAIKNQIDAKTQYGAVGTSSDAASPEQTALGNEVYRAQLMEKSVSANKVSASLWVPSTEANGVDIAEFGVFDSQTAGEMIFRETFSPISKTDDIELYFDFIISWRVFEE